MKNKKVKAIKKHLKGDMKMFEKEKKEDKALLKKISKRQKKR